MGPSFAPPIAHRFDPLDYETLNNESLRSDTEELCRAISYPVSFHPGAFSDQSLRLYPAPFVFASLTLVLGAVAHVASAATALPISSPWILVAGVSLATWALLRVVHVSTLAEMSLKTEMVLAAFSALVLAAAFCPHASNALRLFLILASLFGAGIFAHAVTDHLCAHFRAYVAPHPAPTRDLLASPTPYLVLFVPLVTTLAMPGVLPSLVLPWLPALYLAHRALEAHPQPFGSPTVLLRAATESWLRYGSCGEDAPGAFRSPVDERLPRLLGTILLVLLLASVFAPFPSLLAALEGGVSSPAALFSTACLWIGAALVPLSILGSVALALLASALGDFPATLSLKAGEPALSDPERWEIVTGRIQSAHAAPIRRQILLGFHATEHYPVFLPRDTLREHASVIGATSAGKTSRVLLPLVSQLLRLDEPDGDPRSPVVVIDLKGERYFFNAVRKEAERAGRPFRYFSNHPHRGTHAFNPVLDLKDLGILTQQVALTLHAGLNLEHGTGYGTGFFSAATRNYLVTLFELAPSAESVAEIYAARDKLRKVYLRERERRDIEREAAELISYLKALASRPELNVTSRNATPELFEARISMKRALEDGAVIYFNLFSKGEEAIARFIGSLALECLYAATYRVNEDVAPGSQQKTRKQVYAICDEFQRIAGRNFGVFLEQARSAGLSLILAKQSESLINPELADAVQANTTYRHYFTFRSPEAVSAAGTVFGETSYYLPSDEGIATLKHFLGPRFTPNDVRSLSALPGYAASIQETSRDFSQFHGQAVAIYSPFHITREERDKIADKPLPHGEPGTLTVGDAPTQEHKVVAEPEVDFVPPPPAEGTELAAHFARIHVSHEGYTTEEVL